MALHEPMGVIERSGATEIEKGGLKGPVSMEEWMGERAKYFSLYILTSFFQRPSYSPILKAEAVSSFETTVNFYQNTRRHVTGRS
jgi:hypothetical protein